VDQDIGLPRQTQQDLPRRRRLEVQHQAALAAIDGGEVGALSVRSMRRPTAVLVAARGLDLDHVGPEIGQQLGAMRAGEHPAQIDHADAMQDFHLAVPSVYRQSLAQA
jgi:Ser/Thr protein kinase RdoA (MazF antagonist)